MFRCYDCDYWLVRHQIVCPSCKRRYRSSPKQKPRQKQEEIPAPTWQSGLCPSGLSPEQEEALHKLCQNASWEEVFEDLTEVDDAVEMLWDQFWRVVTPMAQNPELIDEYDFPVLVGAAGKLSGGLEALKSIFPYNQFELENEKQKLINFIDHLEVCLQGHPEQLNADESDG